MQPASRLGDINDGGGSVFPGNPTVLTNGLPQITIGTGNVTPHFCCGVPGCVMHCVAVVAYGSFTVLTGGLPTNRVGDFDSCLHNRATGSLNTLIGG